ncbi:GntR family transcriptional regulator [Brucellaceae bacterium C25G]
MSTDDRNGLSLAERIYQQMRHDIMTCVIMPGTSIDAAAIAETYQASKTPVRDALQRLSGEGLVQVLPRSGYRIPQITFQAVHEILDMRAAIGPHAARQAAHYATPIDVEILRALVEEYKQPLDIGSMQQVARRFHIAIARCSRNERIVTISETLFDELERLLRFAVDFTTQAGQHSDEHTQLVDAIEKHDGELAAKIEADHIAHSRQFLIARLITRGLISTADLNRNLGSITA